jgi:hypothetical protein
MNPCLRYSPTDTWHGSYIYIPFFLFLKFTYDEYFQFWKVWTAALSEEFSSRVAESTRLILVKDGFGGDLGALDRWTDEHRKDTKI